MTLTDLIGIVASSISIIMFIPQAKTVWDNRSDPHALVGVSYASLALLLVNATLWLVYAILAHAIWSGIPSLVNGPLALAMIALKSRASDDRQQHCPGALEPEGSISGPRGGKQVGGESTIGNASASH